MYSVTYVSPTGEHFPLTTSTVPRVQLDADGIEGMVAELTDVTITADTAIGQVLDDVRVGPMTGTLKTRVIAGTERDVMLLYRRFRTAWSRVRTGLLIIDQDEGLRLHTPIRLSGALSSPARDPEDEPEMILEVPVVSDVGLWHGDRFYADGVVIVENPGDVVMYPQIRWSGAGGEVTLPSGATFTLPATEQPRVLYLDEGESCAVLDEEDNLDRTLWPVDGAVAEGVPPAQRREYRLPAGARLEWQSRFFDPWR